MKFVDLDSQQHRIRFELERRILGLIDHGHTMCWGRKLKNWRAV
jgi:hypothetical protein